MTEQNSAKDQVRLPEGWDAVVVSVNGIHEAEDGQDPVWENARHYWGIGPDRAEEIGRRSGTEKPVLLLPLGPGEGNAKNEVLGVFQLSRVVGESQEKEFEKADIPLYAVKDLQEELLGRELLTAEGPVRRPQAFAYIGAWNS
ncbi:hypothetical protein [Micrococcus sp.]|uniref:hypothetical protein n=1 Tax=Micrococcus sp. TaxID=1271 RepID=UPI002A90F607|nr:hypothetical protein [Micrococcus sp.]MDY6054756.1 hypothetical protein [Micrococcus sp.]